MMVGVAARCGTPNKVTVMRSPFLAALLASLSLLAACSSEESSNPGSDNGSGEADTTASTDTGTAADTTGGVDTGEIGDAPAPDAGCENATSLFLDYLDTHQACTQDADCAVVVANESCSCFFAAAAEVNAVTELQSYYQHVLDCGVAPETMFHGCTSDASGPLVVGCNEGRCYANAAGSCMVSDTAVWDAGSEGEQ